MILTSKCSSDDTHRCKALPCLSSSALGSSPCRQAPPATRRPWCTLPKRASSLLLPCIHASAKLVLHVECAKRRSFIARGASFTLVQGLKPTQQKHNLMPSPGWCGSSRSPLYTVCRQTCEHTKLSSCAGYACVRGGGCAPGLPQRIPHLVVAPPPPPPPFLLERNASSSIAGGAKKKLGKCDVLLTISAKRACREAEANRLYGCRTQPLDNATAPHSRPLPSSNVARLWVERPLTTSVPAGSSVSFLLASSAPLQLGRDYFLTACVGPTIALCDRYSQAAHGRLRVTCTVHDPGSYVVRAAHVFANGRGWGAASSSMPRARLLREISWPLLVTPAAVTPHVTPAAVTTHVTREPTREPPQWPQPSASFHLPSRACRTSYAEGRWIRRELVCPSGDDGDSSRISETLDEGVDGTTTASASVHPLCAVPPSESGWQWVPFECYVAFAGSPRALLTRALANRTVLFVGDSTMRFLWGAVANLLEPNATRRFVQFGYGCMVSPSIVGTGQFLGGCDRFDVTTVRIAGTTLIYTQPTTRLASAAKGCERSVTQANALDRMLKRPTHRLDAALVQHSLLGTLCEPQGRQHGGAAAGGAAGAGGGRRLSSSRSRHESKHHHAHRDVRPAGPAKTSSTHTPPSVSATTTNAPPHASSTPPEGRSVAAAATSAAASHAAAATSSAAAHATAATSAPQTADDYAAFPQLINPFRDAAAVEALIYRWQPMVPVLRRGAISWSPWALAPGHCVSLQRLDQVEKLSKAAATAAAAAAAATAAATSSSAASAASTSSFTSASTTASTTASASTASASTASASTASSSTASSFTASSKSSAALADGQSGEQRSLATSLLPMLHITKPLYAVTLSAGVHATPRVNTLLAHMTVAALQERWAGHAGAAQDVDVTADTRLTGP